MLQNGIAALRLIFTLVISWISECKMEFSYVMKRCLYWMHCSILSQLKDLRTEECDYFISFSDFLN